MPASAAPATSDRTDFRTVVLGGTQIGVLTAVAVVAFLVVARQVPPGFPAQLLETLVVLAAGVGVTFLPGRLTEARRVEGIAGAAAIGLCGTVVFMALDIVVLRPFHAYPWTWDAIGGGSTWWYLPVWWMLGTLLAVTGAIVTAGEGARGDTGLLRVATPALAGAVVLATLARVASLGIVLPVAAGAGFTVALAVLAVVALVRRR
jgi:uncharacterized protein (TIGR03382 family)